MTSHIPTYVLIGVVMMCSIGNTESASNTQRSSGFTKVSSILFRPFRLVKISTLSKRTLPIQQPRSTPSGQPKSNVTATITKKNFFTLVKPPKRVTTTTMAPTTTTTRSAPKKNLSLFDICEDICQRDRYTKKYVVKMCNGYRKDGKYRLCIICRYKRRICKRMGSTGLIN